MPRVARLLIPDLPLHIVQRAHNRQCCFFSGDDYLSYLAWLREYGLLYGVQIHAYVLMTNHVHILASLTDVRRVSDFVKRVAQKYAQHLNRRLERSGAWWGGRFYSCPVPDDAHLLACQRYIELNPVRAGLVDTPNKYPWSSFAANAGFTPNEIITPHPTYLALSSSPDKRFEAYRGLFDYPIKPEEASAIRQATAGNFLIGARP